MKKIFWVVLIGCVAVFAILAVWFHFAPVTPKPIAIEKKLHLGKES